MAPADDERSEPDAAARRRLGPDDGTAETSARTDRSITRNVERVADKVKGLLRSDG